MIMFRYLWKLNFFILSSSPFKKSGIKQILCENQMILIKNADLGSWSRIQNLRILIQNAETQDLDYECRTLESWNRMKNLGSWFRMQNQRNLIMNEEPWDPDPYCRTKRSWYRMQNPGILIQNPEPRDLDTECRTSDPDSECGTKGSRLRIQNLWIPNSEYRILRS